MTDLDRLIEAVKAGTATMNDFAQVFPSETAYGKTTWGTAHNAFAGSLDAAKRLHDALLPGWDVDLELRPLGATIDGGLSDALIYAPYSEGAGIRGCDANPARAWLLAILRAVKAKG